MKEHSLKCWPAYWNATAIGVKRFEVRVNDRDFMDGDILILKEWKPSSSHENGKFTGRSLRARVTYLYDGDEFGVPLHLFSRDEDGDDGTAIVVMSIEVESIEWSSIEERQQEAQMKQPAVAGATD